MRASKVVWADLNLTHAGGRNNQPRRPNLTGPLLYSSGKPVCREESRKRQEDLDRRKAELQQLEASLASAEPEKADRLEQAEQEEAASRLPNTSVGTSLAGRHTARPSVSVRFLSRTAFGRGGSSAQYAFRVLEFCMA